MQHMASRLLVRAREIRDDASVVEVVVWQLDAPVPPCTHRYKYRLYYGAGGECRVRYDNERGKGDHRHHGATETVYRSCRRHDCWRTSGTTWKPGGTEP